MPASDDVKTADSCKKLAINCEMLESLRACNKTRRKRPRPAREACGTKRARIAMRIQRKHSASWCLTFRVSLDSSSQLSLDPPFGRGPIALYCAVGDDQCSGFHSEPNSKRISWKRGYARSRALSGKCFEKQIWHPGSRISKASRAWRIDLSSIPAAAAAIARTDGCT